MLSKLILLPALFQLAFACRSPSSDSVEVRPRQSASPSLSRPNPPPSASVSGPIPSDSADRPTAPNPPLPSAKTVSGTGPGSAAPATAAPPALPRRVLVLGDSLSDPRVGGGRYLGGLRKECAVAIENVSRGGFMVNQMRRRFEAAFPIGALAGYTDMIVFGGVNDLYSDETAGRTFEKISADLSALYRRAKAEDLRVIAITVAPWGGFRRYFNERRAVATERLNQWIAEQRTTGLVDVVVDSYAILSCGDPQRLCPDFEPPFKDGLHVGTKGHERLGHTLVDQAFPACAS